MYVCMYVCIYIYIYIYTQVLGISASKCEAAEVGERGVPASFLVPRTAHLRANIMDFRGLDSSMI